MNVRYLSVLLMLAVLVVAGGILPASSAAQTVVGPEYALVKSPINSLQRGERQCDYFLWTKLGGDVQRVSFSYISQDGKSETEAPQIEDLAVVINPAKDVPTARIAGEDNNNRTMWRLEMSMEIYNASKSCLGGISVSKGPGHS
jgi:hypothetical protein